MLSFRKPDSASTNFLAAGGERSVSRQTVLLAVFFAVIVGILSALGAMASYRASANGTSIMTEIQRLPLIAQLKQVTGVADSTDISGASDLNKDRMNILMLGIGGDGHDGAELTDTIILASVDLKNKKVGLLSIPRDLAYPLGEGQFEKINAVNAYFEQDHPGQGALLTAKAFSVLLGQPIDHVIRIDFSGFADFVNAVGGVDVNVERTFTDYQYPTPDDKWTTISFKKGLQHMDGATALVYTRSRHGNNGEGSDFARSRRQQLVLMAVREKILSMGTLTDRRALANLYSAIATHVQTDFTPWSALALAPILQNFSAENITSHVLTDDPSNVLVAANVNGAYMLFPRNPDWSAIRDIAANPFTDGGYPGASATTVSTSSTKATAAAPIVVHSRIEVRNGTTRTGFAAQMAAKLERSGFDVKAFGNAVRRSYEESLVFDLTGGKKPEELAKLKQELHATVSLNPPGTTPPTDGLPAEKPINGSDIDFFVILGEASYPLLNTPIYGNP